MAAPGGADRARGAARRSRPGPPRLHRRPRHAAALGRRVPGDRRGLVRRRRERASRQRRRPLLRDGPRLALGAHAARLRPARPRRAPSTGRPRAPRRSAPPTSAARPTSSSRRRWSATRRASGPSRRRRPGLQLPARPHAPDHPRAGRAGVRRDRPGRRAAGGALRHDGRVRGGLAVSGRLPAGAALGDAGRASWPSAGCRSCTSPRPRSTPTSRTSSTAARRRPTRARSASWSPRRATCRRTTTSPR